MEEVAALKATFQAAGEAFFVEYGKAKTPEARAALTETKRPKASDWFVRMKAIADRVPGDEAAGDALLWIATNASQLDPLRGEVVKTLLASHRKPNMMTELCSFLTRDSSPDSEAALRDLAKSGDPRDVRAQATYSLAMQRKLVATQVEMAKDAGSPRAKRLAETVGAAGAARLATLDAPAVRAEAGTLLDRVLAEFADCKMPYRGTLGEIASGELFEIRHLAIGLVAPEIAAANLDGEQMSLAAFRGKVVVLDFWGDW